MNHIKTLFLILAFTAALAASAAAQDSMANFRSMIENSTPSAADVGGLIAPEILAVTQLPTHPQPGGKVTLRAMVQTYHSMVPYKIASVSVTWWKTGGKPLTAPMKLLDPARSGAIGKSTKTKLLVPATDQVTGIYAYTLPAPVRDGEEIFYTISVTDTWGNAAVELAPDAPPQTIMKDDTDKPLDPSLDIRALDAAASSDGRLRLCLKLGDKPKRALGADYTAYGLFLFGNDVRYKPFLTESEVGSAWLAAYLPALNVRDMAPASELLSLVSGGGGGPKRADVTPKGDTVCYAFNPALLRDDPANGIKCAGVTIALGLKTMSIKPADTTRMLMLYPTVHSFRVTATDPQNR
jgi:hypothetical protein